MENSDARHYNPRRLLVANALMNYALKTRRDAQCNSEIYASALFFAASLVIAIHIPPKES